MRLSTTAKLVLASHNAGKLKELHSRQLPVAPAAIHTLREEKMGALVNTASTRRNGQKMGDTQAMIWASLNVTMFRSRSQESKAAFGG